MLWPGAQTSLSSRVSGLIHSFLSLHPPKKSFQGSGGLTPASLRLSSDSCTEHSRTPGPVPAGRARAALGLGEEQGSRPSVSRKPRHKHLARKPWCWPAERALVSPAWSEAWPRAAEVDGPGAMSSPWAGRGMWVQGGERKSIIQARLKEALPGGRRRSGQQGVNGWPRASWPRPQETALSGLSIKCVPKGGHLCSNSWDTHHGLTGGCVLLA